MLYYTFMNNTFDFLIVDKTLKPKIGPKHNIKVVVFYQKDKVVCILISVKFGYCYLMDPAAGLNKNNKQSYFVVW